MRGPEGALSKTTLFCYNRELVKDGNGPTGSEISNQHTFTLQLMIYHSFNINKVTQYAVYSLARLAIRVFIDLGYGEVVKNRSLHLRQFHIRLRRTGRRFRRACSRPCRPCIGSRTRCCSTRSPSHRLNQDNYHNTDYGRKVQKIHHPRG